jgi:hypothetical protein
LIATIPLVAADARAATVRTVALTGQQAPGKPEGAVFSSLFSSSPVINDAGQTAFRATASDSNFGGIWSEGSGSLNLVALPGQQAPGLPDGVIYSGFDGPQRILINGNGVTAFNGSFTPDNFLNWGFWSSEAGTTTLIARTGEQAAGTPAGVAYRLYDAFRSLVFNDAGQAAFGAFLTGDGVNNSVFSGDFFGIWARRHGNVELIARQGSHAPGTPDGVNFNDLPVQWGPALNNAGQIAFYGLLTGIGVDESNRRGIWSEGTGNLALVVRTGDQAPGMPDGALFNSLQTQPYNVPALNGDGQIAFLGVTAGGGVDATNSSGIWMGKAGDVSLVVRSGDQAPGAPSGVKIGMTQQHSLALNDAGQVAFYANGNGAGVGLSNFTGLWAGAPGSLALVARSGEHAFGTEDGVVFSFFYRPGSPSARLLMLNAAGQTAFFAKLSGNGITGINDDGIWATDSHGAVQLIAREGQLLEVAPGDLRTIINLRFLFEDYTFSTGNADGRPSAFNNRGQLAFAAEFTDGTSGIFVSNRVAVPEPSCVLLVSIGGASLLFVRRQTQRNHKFIVAAIVTSCAAILGFSPRSAHASTLRTVALSGQQMPGMPDGTVFGRFDVRPIVLNDAGQTAFFDGNTIWSEGGGSLHFVAALGQQAPGLPDGVTYSLETFYYFNRRLLISDTGITAFAAYVTGPGVDVTNGVGISSSGPGGSAFVVRSGEQAVGTPAGVAYDFNPSFNSLVINDAGQVAFFSGLTGTSVDSTNDYGIWAQRNGGLRLVAREGNHAPGTSDAVNFSGNFAFDKGIALNKFGQTAFKASLTGSGVDSTNNSGIWSEGSGNLALVARTDSQAPGMPSGANFSFLSTYPALNGAGQTAFRGFVSGGGVDSTNNQGIWSETSGSLALAVRSGDHAPGTPDDVNFSSIFDDNPRLNDAGQIAFFATLAGPSVVTGNNSLGLWSGAPASLGLVARVGEHAPGTADGVFFRNFANSIDGGITNLRTLMFNAAGQTAIFALLAGSGITSSNDLGIWATDRNGTLQLIAREGDLLEVAPGDSRTISTLTFLGDRFTYSTGNADGRPSAFNNLGQIAFQASFTDGTSGIFVSNRVAVPEPSTIFLIALGFVLIFDNRNRNG